METGDKAIDTRVAEAIAAQDDSYKARITAPVILTFEHVAELAHEANRGYCESLGDFSQTPWDVAPEWQKRSAIKGVLFHSRHPEATPENSHESWLMEKTRDGWKYGPIKDPEKKEHPCMVPYHQLPFDQRAKDHIFRAIVHAALKL